MDRDLLFGIVCFVAGVLCIIKVIYERKTAIRLPGTITGNSQDGRGNYFPIVAFQYEGQEYSIPGGNGSSKPKYSEGDKVEVLYRPSNQKYVNLVGSNLDIVYSIVFLVAGIALIICNVM